MKNQIPSVDTTQVTELEEEKLQSVQIDRKIIKSKSNVCTTPLSVTKIYEENNTRNQLIDEDYFDEYQDKQNNQIQRNFNAKNYSSPIWSYYESSQKYLSKILRAKSEIINNKPTIDYYEQSNNYIRKDSFFSKPSNEDHCNNEFLLDNINDIEQEDLMNNNHPNAKFNVSPMSNPYFMPNSLSEQPLPIPRCNSYSYEQKMKILQKPQIKIPHQNPMNTSSNQQQETNYISSIQNNPLNSQDRYYLDHGNDDPYMTSMFGRIGWICTLCNNFNYESRHKCNRCKQDKSPKLIRSHHTPSPVANVIYNNTLNNNSQINNQSHNTFNSNINTTFNNTNNINVNVNVNINQTGTNPNNYNQCQIQVPNQNHSQNHSYNHNPNQSQNHDQTNNLHSLNMLSMTNNSNLIIYNNNVNINHTIICNNNNTCNLNEKSQLQQQNQKLEENSIDMKKRKPFSDRNGDWICFYCKNVNFSFRITCNRCQIIKGDSDSNQVTNNN